MASDRGNTRERVTGIGPAFSAWKPFWRVLVTRRVARNTCSDDPCGPVGFGSCCLGCRSVVARIWHAVCTLLKRCRYSSAR